MYLSESSFAPMVVTRIGSDLAPSVPLLAGYLGVQSFEVEEDETVYQSKFKILLKFVVFTNFIKEHIYLVM
ncbi:hypothetical protein P4S73_04585 [Paraglaciecola sp. Hal342]